MKKIAIVGLVIGLVLLIAGIGIRVGVDSKDEVRDANQALTFLLGEKLSPSLVSKIMNGEMKVFGETISLDDILEMADNADAQKLRTGLKLYAYSPLMTIIGGVLTVLSLVAFIFAKKKR